MQLTTPLRSSPKERDSRNVHHSRRTLGRWRDSHPQRRSFPRSSNLGPRKLYATAAQLEAQGPYSSTEHVPVHSPLLRSSFLVSSPPLTYMLKFSGNACLNACQRCSQRAHTTRPRDTQQEDCSESLVITAAVSPWEAGTAEHMPTARCKHVLTLHNHRTARGCYALNAI